MNDLINMNSLTDIVSNSIGMLILFALITLTQNQKQVHQVEIPIEHSTKLAPQFFICRNDAIIKLDTEKTLKRAIMRVGAGAIDYREWFSLGYMDVQAKVERNFGLVIDAPKTDMWERIDQLQNQASPMRAELMALDGKKYFAFFFVYDDPQRDGVGGSGFEGLRKARAMLKKRGVKSGFRLVDSQHLPHICFWSDVLRCRYRPAHY